MARKRTNGLADTNASDMANIDHSRMVNMDRLQEIIHPEYSSSSPFASMGGFRRNYISEPGVPNNNDLYALMELTKNSGIKEVGESHDAGKRFAVTVLWNVLV